MPMHQYKNPWPGVHEVYNFAILFLVHHYYTLSLSDLCLCVERTLYFHYTVIWPCPSTRNPGVMKFTILVDPSLVMIIIYLFVWSMPGIRDEDLKEKNKRPMGHIAHLRKQFKSINTIDYIITLIKRRKKTLLSLWELNGSSLNKIESHSPKDA